METSVELLEEDVDQGEESDGGRGASSGMSEKGKSIRESVSYIIGT